jgi:bifunctional non-homologous end joining protein LigD
MHSAPGAPDMRWLLYAFDLMEHDGDDLCSLSLLQRKRRLAKLIGSQRRAIRFVEHLTGDGPTIFHHVCRLGLEGIVSKRTDAPYRSGPSKTWVKAKNRRAMRCGGSARRNGDSRAHQTIVNAMGPASD